MDFELYIKFYKSASGNQNIWIEKNGIDGKRCEVNSMEDLYGILQDYIKNFS